MFKWLGSLTDSNEKQVQRLKPLVEEINEHEEAYGKLSNDELKAKTQEFKDYIVQSTQEPRDALKRAQQEIEETRGRLSTTDEIEREELNGQIKRLEEQAVRLEKELRDAEEEI